MDKQYTIPIFVPHLGCPFDCIFCNQERITGCSTNVTKEDVKNIIDEYLSYFDRKVRVEVGFFGGSFTGIDREIQKELLEVAYEYKKQGKIKAIRLSTRPDFINEEILSLLVDYGVDVIELGVQSLEDSVLEKSGRGHTSKEVYDAIDLIRSKNINVGLQMMVGLPGDSFEKSLNTCKKFIEKDPYCVRIYPTLVIKDTNLEKRYLEGAYKALDLDTAIKWVSIYFIMFELKNIDIIRVGLQPTDNIQLGKDVIAGPFHPAFRQLVESYIYRNIIETNIKNMNIDTESKELIIKSNPKYISSISGQKGNNKDKLFKEYKFKGISFKSCKEYLDKDFEITINNKVKKIDYYKSIEYILKDRINYN